jgi:hypothetical protein
LYPAIDLDPGMVFGQPILYIEPAAHRVYRAVKLDQQPIAHAPDQPAAMLGDFGLD